MTRKIQTTTSAILLACAITISNSSSRTVWAANLPTPQSLVLEHEAITGELTRLAARVMTGDPVGIAAGKALPLVKAHFAKEVEFVFPPLSLLRELANGRIAPEQIRIAIEMSDRTKAAQATLEDEHLRITSLMIDLKKAASNDPAVADFATHVVTHSLDEIEVLFPVAIVLGDYLRTKYPSESVKPMPAEQGSAQSVQSKAMQEQDALLEAARKSIVQTIGAQDHTVEVSIANNILTVSRVNSSMNESTHGGRDNEATAIASIISKAISGKPEFGAFITIFVQYVSRPTSGPVRVVDTVEFRKDPQGQFQFHRT